MNIKKMKVLSFGSGRGRRLPLAAVALGTLAFVALAIRPGLAATQDQTAPPEPSHQGRTMAARRGHEMHWLSKKLSLTKDQKAKIRPILENQRQQMRALRQDSSLSQQEKRARFMEIRSKTIDQIRPILTEEQRATLEQIQKQRQERMKAWREKHQGSQGSAPQSQ
ncbi:MAG TPA: hypothetical protein VFZ08_14575 [Terriglobia bacterium]|nr:hypothetical protein [Terriglobia bacterium]